VAGANKVLKDGQVLFQTGDAPDGMYLIRKGELRIYLEQDGKEVTLANVTTGSMIGEMGLFDKQVRSASVKSVGNTEVTHISMHDFNRLMKQIPKWFVGLMSALSGRLRDTNARLQRMEAGGHSPSKPFRDIGRYFNLLILLWNKDGTKEGREHTLNRKSTEETMVSLFDEDPLKLKQFFEVLVKEGYLSTKTDSYKNVVFVTKNKGALSQLAEMISQHAAKISGDAPKCLSDEALVIIEVLEGLTQTSPYDSFSASIVDLMKEAKRQGIITTNWEKCMVEFKDVGDALRLVKMSDGVGLKTSKKLISPFLQSHKSISKFVKSNLS